MSWACSAWGALEACRAGSLDAAALQQARAEGAAAQAAAQRVVEA